jgi:hypothetical protein
MSKVRKVIRMVNYGKYAIVTVLMQDGDEEYQVFIGGQAETYHHKGVNKAFIRKAPK